MPEYSLKQVLEASMSGRYLSSPTRIDSKAFSLITDDRVNLSLRDLDAISDLIRYIEEEYKVRLRITGGGAGCTKFDFEIEGCPKAAAEFVKALMNDTIFLEKALEAKFKVVFSPDGPTHFAIGDQSMKNAGPINVNIHNSTVSGLQVGSDGSSQVATQTSSSNEGLSIVLRDLTAAITALDEKEVPTKGELVEDVETLKKEFSRKEPRHGILTQLLGNMGSVASLASLADQLYPFIPVLK